MEGNFGAFGKIPALGDFFRFGLPTSFLEPWDIWLQDVMITSKAAFQDSWNDAYMSASIWRFSLAKDQMGPTAMIGIVMPSVDRVGRQFPLTMTANIDTDDLTVSHLANQSTFIELENLALAALDDTMTLDTLKSDLSDINPIAAAKSQTFTTSETITVISPDPVAALAAPSVQARFKPECIFSSDLGDTQYLKVMNHLPLPEQADMLFWPVDDLRSGSTA